MPYRAIKKNGKVEVVNADSGKVHAKATTPAKAAAQLRLLRGIDHGWKPNAVR